MFNFSNQVTLNQAFVTKITEYDFSSHISIQKRFVSNNVEVAITPFDQTYRVILLARYVRSCIQALAET